VDTTDNGFHRNDSSTPATTCICRDTKDENLNATKRIGDIRCALYKKLRSNDCMPPDPVRVCRQCSEAGSEAGGHR
jgi:hypothetical protein